MAQLTPEELQAKVERVKAIAKAIYEAIVKSEAPTSLGLAARNHIPFEKLDDEDVIAMATIAAAAVQSGITLAPAPAVLPAPSVDPTKRGKPKGKTNGDGAKGEPIKPDSIIPPPSGS